MTRDEYKMTGTKRKSTDDLDLTINNKRPNNNINPLKKNKEPDDDELNELLLLLFPPKHGNGPNNHVRWERPPPPEIETQRSMECRNPLCNHKSLEDDSTPVVIPTIKKITSIENLIMLGKTFHCKKHTEYGGLNLRILCNLITPLTELNGMIGMDTTKEHIVNQILFFLKGNHVSDKCNNCSDCSFDLPCLNSQTEMLHTVITGPPGVGKTEFGKILGKVYKEMGILSKGTFKLATRADLIAGYLGQTAIKTQRVIDEAKGGVLFIDEAYSLGNKDLRDSFSKECIDTLNQNLSERRNFLCIIAGYENELENCFFKYNDGLRRRFTFRYNMKPYNHSELFQIFERKVRLANWGLCYTHNKNDTPAVKKEKDKMRNQLLTLFKSKQKCFPNYGGDMETLLLNCKIVNTQKCNVGSDNNNRILSVNDIVDGVEAFAKHRKHIKPSSEMNKHSEIANVNFNKNVKIYS
jgi:hypothetical protein